MQNKQSWVKNKVADEVVQRVKETINTSVDRKALASMMDLVSGVQNYNIRDPYRQGHIRKIFDKERAKHKGGRGINTINLTVDIDDVISTFWQHVFKYLPQAATTGEMVSVRVVGGQDNVGPPVLEDSSAGINMVSRSTNCNPAHYLRNAGLMGVRNLLNSTYRHNLMHVCDDCGINSGTSPVEVSDICPKCQSTDTIKYWPDGNSSYRAKKTRKCNTCEHQWTRQFTRKCSKCGSVNIRTEARCQAEDDKISQLPGDESSAESELVNQEYERELVTLIDNIAASLPTDPRNPKAISRTMEIFDIMMRPNAGKAICKMCVASAPLICVECTEPTCTHQKVPDPEVTCGAESFALTKCINFSKKIGQYHKCSASLAARRVKKVRQYVIKYIQANKDQDICTALNILLRRCDLLSEQ